MHVLRLDAHNLYATSLDRLAVDSGRTEVAGDPQILFCSSDVKQFAAEDQFQFVPVFVHDSDKLIPVFEDHPALN